MKIRKTVINERETNVFVYENRKEEYTLVAIPQLEWSYLLDYDVFRNEMVEKLVQSLERTSVNKEEVEALANRLFQWTREM